MFIFTFLFGFVVSEEVSFLLYVLSKTNFFFNRPIWPIDGTLTSATTPDQIEPGFNGYE